MAIFLKIQAVPVPVVLLSQKNTEENHGILRGNPAHHLSQGRICDVTHVPDPYHLTCSWRLLLLATPPPIISTDLILPWFTVFTFCMCCSELQDYLRSRVLESQELPKSWSRAISQLVLCSPKSVLISISEIALQLWLQWGRPLS